LVLNGRAILTVEKIHMSDQRELFNSFELLPARAELRNPPAIGRAD
jgi:hypothetical protein